MTHGSLFSGIGGFDLAAEWAGWQNVFHCEWNEFGQKVLKYYWPNAESFTDITKTNFSKYENKIDVLSGGFPCQPYSLAGKRRGKDDERHLWPQMCRAIREIKPRWVVGENVFGLVNWSGGLVFNEVQADLEAEGYEVFPVLLPAAAVNAPHRRDRIWFIAYNHNFGFERYAKQIRNRRDSKEQIGCIDICKKKGWNEIRCLNERSSKDRRDVTNTLCNGSDKGRKRRQSKFINKNGIEGGISTNTKSIRQEYALENRELERKRSGFANQRNAWHSFPSVSPICNGDDGISNRLDSITFPKWRNESIKAGGNAIVPQVALQIFNAINEYENLNLGTEVTFSIPKKAKK